MDTTGSIEDNIITIVVLLIDNFEVGQVFTDTWAMAHFSLLGLNFHFPLDRAPHWGTYIIDYTIQ